MSGKGALGVACAILLTAQPALAQFSPGVRSAGMAGAGMVFSTGVDAVELNPANLAFGSGWSVSVGEVGGSAVLGGVTIGELVDLLNEEAEASAIVQDLPASGLYLSSQTEGFTTARVLSAADLPEPGSPLPTLGISFGNMGLRVRSLVLGEAKLSKELADLMVNEFDPSRLQEYRVGDTGFRSTSVTEIGAAYGTVLGDRLGIGVGLRYVIGHSNVRTRFFGPELDLANETATVRGVAVESPGGHGYGLDVGISLELLAGLRVSASGTNIIQKMTWDDDLIGHEAAFLGCDPASGPTICPGDDFELELEELVDRFQAAPIDLDAASLPVYQTAQELFSEAFFPTVFRLGVGWRSGGSSVELVGSSVSPRGRQHAAWEERLALGAEQRLWILTLRAGGAKATDGIQTLSAGLGIGLGPVDLDVSGGLMSGGFDLTSGVITSEDVDYAGSHLAVSLRIHGGGS